MVEYVDDIGGQSFVDQHRRVAQWEMIRRKGSELHRVLQQARPGGKAWPRQVGGPRVVIADRMKNPPIINTGAVRDFEELVRNRELHVPPGVGEQLAEFGLLRRRSEDFNAQSLEDGAGAVEGNVSCRADELRQAPDLLQGVALGNPLRAERDVDLQSVVDEAPLNELGRPRIDRAAEDDQRAVDDVGGQLVDRPLVDPHRWVHELVDRRPNDHHDDLAVPDQFGAAAKAEPPGRQHAGE